MCHYGRHQPHQQCHQRDRVHNSPDDDGHWEYGETADSDIDVGISYDSGRIWGADGTAHVGNSGGGIIAGNTSVLWGKYVGTTFKYAHGYYACASYVKFIRPVQWIGGTQFTHDVSVYDCLDAPQSGWRVRYEQGTSFTKNAARASRFGVGATIGPFTARSTSGYSSRVDMSWNWVRNWGYLCGNNNYPLQAGIVYAY